MCHTTPYAGFTGTVEKEKRQKTKSYLQTAVSVTATFGAGRTSPAPALSAGRGLASGRDPVHAGRRGARGAEGKHPAPRRAPQRQHRGGTMSRAAAGALPRSAPASAAPLARPSRVRALSLGTSRAPHGVTRSPRKSPAPGARGPPTHPAARPPRGSPEPGSGRAAARLPAPLVFVCKVSAGAEPTSARTKTRGSLPARSGHPRRRPAARLFRGGPRRREGGSGGSGPTRKPVRLRAAVALRGPARPN